VDAGTGDEATTDGAAEGGPIDAGPFDAGPEMPGTVKVNRGTTLGTIGAGFAGFSYEKAHLTDGFFSGGNAALIGIFKLLGPGVLRVGGNQVDRAVWAPNGAAADAGAASITKQDVDNLAAFVKAAGWSVIYGVNMKTSNPAAAADEAAYAAADLGSSLYGFEIGNEVDLYKATALSSTWSYAIFKTQWESFASAIRGAVGASVPLTGPASAYNYKAYTIPFAADEGSRIVLLTQHYYRANGQDPTSTLDELLKPDPALLTMLDAVSTAATSANIANQYRLAEANSFYNGGANGISDAYGTALWAIDFLFTNAAHGSTGVNFHGGGNSAGYTPIADANGMVVEARPELYGILTFALAGIGPLYATTTSAGALNFTAYAVGHADGSTDVVLVDKDPAMGVRASVDIGKPVSVAGATRLRGTALADTTGTTVGGATIGADGSFSPSPPALQPVSGNVVTVDVPAASAALVHVN
jgi:hypothetical protein